MYVCVYVYILIANLCPLSKCTYLKCELFFEIHTLAGVFLITFYDHKSKTPPGHFVLLHLRVMSLEIGFSKGSESTDFSY